jgi:hypothetical protein
MKETETFDEPTVHRMVLRFALVIGLIILAAQCSVLLRINLTGIGLFVLAAIPAVGLVGIELVLEPIAEADRRRDLQNSLDRLLKLLRSNVSPPEFTLQFTDPLMQGQIPQRGYQSLPIDPETINRALTGTLLDDYVHAPSTELRFFATNVTNNPLPSLTPWDLEMFRRIALGMPFSEIVAVYDTEPWQIRERISAIFLQYLHESGALQSGRRSPAKQEE